MITSREIGRIASNFIKKGNKMRYTHCKRCIALNERGKIAAKAVIQRLGGIVVIKEAAKELERSGNGNMYYVFSLLGALE